MMLIDSNLWELSLSITGVTDPGKKLEARDTA